MSKATTTPDILEDASQDAKRPETAGLAESSGGRASSSEKKRPDIHIGDKILFFGRLSDITRLPDWFKEDEFEFEERHRDKWNFFLAMFRAYKIDVLHSDWYKILFSTNDKTQLYLPGEMAVVMSICAAGYGKLALVDGYPKDVIASFGHNIGLALQIKRLNNTLPPEDDLYKPLINGLAESFVKLPTRIIYVNSVETHNEIGNWRREFERLSTEYKVHFVDLSEKDWMKNRFPALHKYWESKNLLEEKHASGLRGAPSPYDEEPPLARGSGGISLN